MDPAQNAQLEALITSPREDLHIEVKSWLDLTDKAHQATLSRAAIALANHGGGFIVIGLADEKGVFTPAPGRPETLDGFAPDVISRIIATYTEPALHVLVHHVSSPAGAHPIIQIPGGHRTPIQAKRGSTDGKTLSVGKVYIRRPPIESAEPATAAEWRELIDRCVRAGRDDMLDAIRGIMSGAAAAAEPVEPSASAKLAAWAQDGMQRWEAILPHTPTGALIRPPGYYQVAYRLTPEPEPLATPQLLAAISRATTRYTGWPPWWVPTRDGIRPYVKDGAVECNLAEGEPITAHSDFWRVSPQGEALLIRGYSEDDIPHRYKPGTVFDLTVPVWRVGDCLMQAAAFAAVLGVPDAEVNFTVQWRGLAGRELVHVQGTRFIHEGRICRQDAFDHTMSAIASSIPEQLPELVHGFMAPLYGLFDFLELPKALVDEELKKMLSGRS